MYRVAPYLHFGVHENPPVRLKDRASWQACMQQHMAALVELAYQHESSALAAALPPIAENVEIQALIIALQQRSGMCCVALTA